MKGWVPYNPDQQFKLRGRRYRLSS